MRIAFVTAWVVFALAVVPACAQTCAFSITPTTSNFPAAGGSDVITIALTSGPSSCQRTATSNASWVTISFGTPGTGNGTVGYTVQSNPFTSERTGTITVAGQTFTVVQAAGSCTYSISSTSASVSANGGTGSFTLTTSLNSCPWTATSSAPDWLTVSSGSAGTGSTTVRYNAAPNSSTTARSAAISVGGQTFTVNQSGQCTFTLNPPTASVSAVASTGSITVAASANSCAWTAASQSDWITLTGAGSGTGNGTVSYSIAANNTGSDRTGSVTIGTTGFTVFQSGSACNLTFSANGRNFPAEGGSGGFYVTGACPWTPTSNAPWITVTSGASSTGSGAVNYVVTGNTDTAARTGVITVGSRTYVIQQAGVPCSVTLSAYAASVSASGTSGAIHVSAGSGCAWAASAGANWITLANPTGTGEGDILYAVSANTSAQSRKADVVVANQRFTITQEPATCDYRISPAQAAFPSSGGSGVLAVSTNCSWSAASSAPWITIVSGGDGTGGGNIAYTVAANTALDARAGTIRISGQTVTINQSGKDCSLSVAPTAVQLPGRGGTAVVSVAGSKGCRWEPRPDSPWLDVPTWSAVDGSGNVTIRAASNPDPSARFGAIVIGGQAIAVAQGGLEITLAAAGILNAASFAGGPVSPGEILTIFGTGLGPADLVKPALSSDGEHLASKLAGTEVRFDGTPAPLIYVSASQISAVVPYSVVGRTATEMRVINQGVASDAIRLPVTAVSPGIFTVDASGRGQAAVLNQDNTINSARNAAARNTVIQIFATGEGETIPPGEDGRIANGTNLPRPRQNVSVTIGGQTAAVTYAGAAPGAVAGLFQVNVRIPQTVAVGNAVPLVIAVGQARSQNNVTIAVR